MYPICVTSVHESQISSISLTSCCWVTCHFEKTAPSDTKMTLNPTGSNVPNSCVTSIHEAQSDNEPYKVKLPYICITSVRDSQISPPFRSMTTTFPDTGHFETSAPNDPKLTLNHTTSHHPLYFYNNCPQVSNFTPFRSTTSRNAFGNTGHVETCSPNDLKMTLNTTRSKVQHICVTSVPSPKFWSVCSTTSGFHDIALL